MHFTVADIYIKELGEEIDLLASTVREARHIDNTALIFFYPS